MTKYMVDKFMRYVELSDARVAAYVADPAAYVEGWLGAGAGAEGATDDRVLTEAERAAFAARDYAALYALGAHPYLLWHFTEAVHAHEFTPEQGWRELVERYRAGVAPQGVVDYIP
ncbi:hypothetical protein [Agromyces sp. S2-1-8]|uniref:hypothetical protein n=1 Tax=Agromyces sp. S2-1-8 TaxID=2897180 RepID=UPI001E3B121C|nr:hypothetical protein [Agromyces sp. S2-1-8]MCD5345702.1 hypothetical protein [Agromyces sp. S2-1-8]